MVQFIVWEALEENIDWGRAVLIFKPEEKSIVRAWFGRERGLWRTSITKRHQQKLKRTSFRCVGVTCSINDIGLILPSFSTIFYCQQASLSARSSVSSSTTLIGRTSIDNPQPLLCDVIVTFSKYRDLPPQRRVLIFVRHSDFWSTTRKEYLCYYFLFSVLGRLYKTNKTANKTITSDNTQ